MLIYIIFRAVFISVASFLKMDAKKGFVVMELFIVSVYLVLLYYGFFSLDTALLLWFLSWIIVISLYKIVNYIFISRSKILAEINKNITNENKQAIKRFFLKPIILNFIYYFIWLLPWNICYYIFFKIMEKGWYFRVWLVSFRDIFFWRIFKWDSRMFFFELNKKIFENRITIFLYFFKEKLVKTFIRLMVFISFIRRNLLGSSIYDFFISRVVLFCYLSLFYLYVIEGLLLFNRWLFYLFIFIEFLFLFFFDDFILFLLKKDHKNKNCRYLDLLTLFFTMENLRLLLDPLNLTFYTPAKIFFETNNMVWNKILGSSLSLNILYEFMLYVNKNTNGYYFYRYGISTKMKSIKLYDLSNIPWDILPKTIYVVMSMRYVQQNIGMEIFVPDSNGNIAIDFPNDERFKNLNKEEFSKYYAMFPDSVFDFRIKVRKNMYLSIYEKTYLDNTLLFTVNLLKLNYDTLYTWLYFYYYSKLLKDKKLDEIFFIFDKKLSDMVWSKTEIWKLKLIEIHKNNPELFRIEYVLHLFEYKSRRLDISSDYMMRFDMSDTNLPILSKDLGFRNLSLKAYKQNIKLLSKLSLYEEEAIVWNKDLLNYFMSVEESKKNIDCSKYLNEINDIFSKFGNSNEQSWRSSGQNDLKQLMIEYYGVRFNKDIDLNLFYDFNLNTVIVLGLTHHGYKVSEINCVFLGDFTIMEECDNLVLDLESLSANSFEIVWKDGTLRAAFNKDVLYVSYKKYVDSNK